MEISSLGQTILSFNLALAVVLAAPVTFMAGGALFGKRGFRATCWFRSCGFSFESLNPKESEKKDGGH